MIYGGECCRHVDSLKLKVQLIGRTLFWGPRRPYCGLRPFHIGQSPISRNIARRVCKVPPSCSISLSVRSPTSIHLFFKFQL